MKLVTTRIKLVRSSLKALIIGLIPTKPRLKPVLGRLVLLLLILCIDC